MRWDIVAKEKIMDKYNRILTQPLTKQIILFLCFLFLLQY